MAPGAGQVSAVPFTRTRKQDSVLMRGVAYVRYGSGGVYSVQSVPKRTSPENLSKVRTSANSRSAVVSDIHETLD